jgi:hypothetical protein
MPKPTTARVSVKRYQCVECKAIEQHNTNHWGEIYPRCRSCGWKNPMAMAQRFVCLEPCPSTHDTPEPWKLVKLGDIVEIVEPHVLDTRSRES